MAKKIPIGAIVDGVTSVVTNKSVQRAIFGSYSDGSPRSLLDCIDGEIISPKDKEKYIYKKKKKDGKSKKKKKVKIDID